MRDSRFDPLFEPLAIGPVVAPNRFYQVPHCNGGGYRDPSAVAEMRRIKSEGGWGVVFTEQVEIHPSSEITPYIELRIWDDDDVPMLARMADAIHQGGEALAGIELTYSGVNGPNLYTREVPLAPTALPIRTFTNDPVCARAMSKRDIKDLRRWYRQSFARAKVAGFDLVCLYGAHGFGVIQHFLSPLTNHRTDEYGGSLENRSRLLRELISDAKDEIGDSMAVTVRLSLDEMLTGGFSNDEVRDLIGSCGELPDLWDLAHGSWEDCSATSRFKPEAAQQELVAGIKSLTSKPVVGVGRFTSPDVMVKQINSGVLDFIGCARPSIADPWLPRKIDEGRVEDIRECIGCNICVSGDMTMSLSRCTQNPTFMEEWRKDWHPEKMNSKGESGSVLVVGAGPAGLEATRALGERGYDVMLAEASTELGGRVSHECKLPGLGYWSRVRDYREYQISQMANVQVFRDNRLSADDIMQLGIEHVAIATGSHWRRDGVSRYHVKPLADDGTIKVFTPDDIMAGKTPAGNVLVFDDDHYYMGSVIAEQLQVLGCAVTLATPSAYVAEWTLNTLEQEFIQQKLVNIGVNLMVSTALTAISQSQAHLVTSTQKEGSVLAFDAIVYVTSKAPDNELYLALQDRQSEWSGAGIKTVTVIGDAEAPAPIAWATYAGHRYARELDTGDRGDALPFKREVTQLKPVA